MLLSRRELLIQAAVAASLRRVPESSPQPLTLDPSRLTPFVDALPRLVTAQPIAPGRYRIVMRETACQLHRDLPPTRCWTYGGTLPGPLIETRSGVPFDVEWVNALPPRHFLPIDPSLEGAGPGVPEVRAVVHLHGGRTPPASDGYPEDWTVPGQSQHCHYPNRQEAALLFYHDHAMGINRLNIYAGLFGLLVVRDAIEDSLKLPSGDYEMPLVLRDRWLTPEGQLYYPVSEFPGRIWVPEVFGNVPLVNGKLWPELEVEPRAYRFRVLNVANSRFFHLSLGNGQPLTMIGSDQGLLATPATMRSVMLAPAERADLIVDFSGHAGDRPLLMNDTMTLMRFRVRGGASAVPYRAPEKLRAVERIPETAAARRRTLTLDEYDDRGANPMLMLLDGKYWHDPVTERAELGGVEVWEFINLTDDTHPIHLHLVRFQVLDRRPFDVDQYLDGGGLRFMGPAAAPGADEMGWKDTVRCYSGDVTRIIVRFEGYAGRYLWHCHLLEHEANAMMRPYEIVTSRVAATPL